MTQNRYEPAEAPGTPGMTVRVRELTQDNGMLRVRVAFGDDAEYNAEVTDPADEASETRLAWYFEQHLRYPFLDRDIEQQVIQQIASYGEALFEQVFGGTASGSYRKLRDQGFHGSRLEVSGSAALHRLHWEALQDPDLSTPLAMLLPIIRRVDAHAPEWAVPEPRPTLNILAVTARPAGSVDIGYRTISRPLLDAIRPGGLAVMVDLVRPGTWAALQAQVRSATERHGTGWYHAVHFDLHGVFIEYILLEAGRRAGRLLFSSGPPVEFDGGRGFLLFETERDGVAEPVSAEQVASLLVGHQIPVAVLNACQSAMQSASETSLAQGLAEAGVQVSVGMAYSVTVSAAARAMPVLYGRLAAGAEPAAALQAARRELHEHKSREAHFDQQIDLEDWMLPVMFGQRSLQIPLRDMTREERRDFDERTTEEIGDEPATEYGFVGRDLDIQAIERRLLTRQDSNELLVQGMAGAGKSTLLAHLAWWWQRTGLVEQVFYFSYAELAWTSGQIVRQIRAALLSPAEQARADAMDEAAQIEQVAQHLRASRHLLILDNAESITAVPAAVPHSLGSGEQQQLKALLSRLRGGRTLVLLGSREPEAWLTSASADPGIYPLPGLDPQATSVLVERILRRHGTTHYLEDTAERRALQDLVKVLGGYPLPLTVILPALASNPPSLVLAEMKAGGSAADPAGLMDRAIAYSYEKIPQALQNSLLPLAPFTSVIHTGPILQRYQQILDEHEAVQVLGPIDLADALGHAVTVGLAVPHPQLEQLVLVQPVLPYFLRSRLRDQPALHAAADQAHYQLYHDLGADLSRMLSSKDSPQLRSTGRATTQAEHANLTAALDHALRNRQPCQTILGALTTYLHQMEQYGTCRQLLYDAIAAYAEPVGKEQQRELAMIHGAAGLTALKQHRLNEARAHYETELRLLRAADNRPLQGSAYHQLGRVAHEQRQYDEAEDSYRKALGIYLEYGNQEAASAYHQLGMVAQDRRRYDEAEDSYRNALSIYLDTGERYECADVYGQLGLLAQDLERFADARTSYRKALSIYLEFGNQEGAASAYQQLGVVAGLQGRPAEAEASYRKTLDIRLALGDQHGAAITYRFLAILAARDNRFSEAESGYRKALDIFLEYGDLHRAADVYHELGTLALNQYRFTEGEASCRKALDIYLEFDDRYMAAFVYHNLGLAAQGQREFSEAESCFRKALDIFLEYGDLHRAAAAHHQLGMIAQDQQRFTEAEGSYRKALGIYLQLGDQQETAQTYHNLGTLATDQGQYNDAEACFRKALDIYQELDPRTAALTAVLLSSVLTELGRHDAAARIHSLRGRLADDTP